MNTRSLASAVAIALLGHALACGAEVRAAGAERRTADAGAAESRSSSGLGFRVDIDPGRLTLRRPQDLVTGDRNLPGLYTGATDPILAVAFGEGPARSAGSSWVHRVLSGATSDGPARAVVSRLSPAVLLEMPGKTLRLLPAQADQAAEPRRPRSEPIAPPSDGRLPRYLAWIADGRPVVCKVDSLGRAAVKLDEPWMLAWFGADTVIRGHARIIDVDSKAGASKLALEDSVQDRLDVPLLIRFERRPTSVALSDDQLVLEFAASGKVAIMPLFGRRIWLPKETEAWAPQLPEPVLAQCRRWSRWLRDYPLTVDETYQVDEPDDALSVRQEFTWESMQDDWQTPAVKAAPLPPMLAVALGGGVPVTFSVDGKPVQPVDGNLMDMAGKMLAVEGADQYEYRFAGLGAYLWASAAPVSVAAEAQPFQRQLERHVEDMVAAGHLRPLFLIHGGLGIGNAGWYWVGTPQTAYALARAYPYLSPELQAKVRSYVKREWEQFPPLELSPRLYREGTPREPYEIDGAAAMSSAHARDEFYRRRNFLLDLYRIEAATAVIDGLPDTAALREPAAALAKALQSQQDWAIAGPVRLRQLRAQQDARFTTLQGSAAYNSWLGGAIGLARLGRKHGWNDEQRLACYLAGKLALARVGQARYVAEMHAMGLVRGAAEDDYRAVSHIDQYGTLVRWGAVTAISAEDQEFPPFIDLTPETGRLLRAHAGPECATYLRYLDYAVPYWYLSEAPKQSATEHHICPLWHQSNVLAQAWILDKRGAEFCRYVDATRFRGDLFYIQNLVAAIESFSSPLPAAKRRWERGRG